jgi:hypothetical protein
MGNMIGLRGGQSARLNTPARFNNVARRKRSRFLRLAELTRRLVVIGLAGEMLLTGFNGQAMELGFTGYSLRLWEGLDRVGAEG